MDVNEELKFCENAKKIGGGGWGEGVIRSGRSGREGVRVDVNEELRFCENAKKVGGGVRVRSGVGRGLVGGGGWLVARLGVRE